MLRLEQLPVFCNALLPDRASALAAPRGDLELCYSPETGYLWNQAFNPELTAYNPSYENSLHYSPRFVSFATQLVDRLVARYELSGKRIVEIGCGEGNFLAQLCERGNTGVGYDPSYDPTRLKVATSAAMRIEADYYPTEQPIDADLVVCQHVLEHVADPASLLAGVRRSLVPTVERRTAVYFEVPDATYMVEQLAVWDLIYEHMSYFSAPTVRLLFESCGFDVTDIDRSFGDQYLYVEAVAGSAPASAAAPVDTAELTKLTELVATFGEHVKRLVAYWNTNLAALVQMGPVALWGAGSKGVTFLNLIEAGREVTHVIDVNPNKTDLYVPGTGHCISGPDALIGAGVQTVLVMNPLYVSEVQSMLALRGLQPDVLSVS